MPASVVSFSSRRQGIYVVLEAALPGRPPRNVGVLLIDPSTNRGFLKIRDHFDDWADPDDAEVLDALGEDIRARLVERGAEAFLTWAEDTWSNALRVSERQSIEVDSFSWAVEQIYASQVDSVEVKPFRTHLPLYSLRAAAGHLGEEMQSDAEDWIPAPEGLKLTPDLFVAHVVGRSMEPRIPDGSLNLFRLKPAGSRQNKILLIERFGVLDATSRYTVKKYTSEKVRTSEDEWHHERIRLVPLNPEFEAWDVDPEGFAVVAEWLRVIE